MVYVQPCYGIVHFVPSDYAILSYNLYKDILNCQKYQLFLLKLYFNHLTHKSIVSTHLHHHVEEKDQLLAKSVKLIFIYVYAHSSYWPIINV